MWTNYNRRQADHAADVCPTITDERTKPSGPQGGLGGAESKPEKARSLRCGAMQPSGRALTRAHRPGRAGVHQILAGKFAACWTCAAIPCKRSHGLHGSGKRFTPELADTSCGTAHRLRVVAAPELPSERNARPELLGTSR